VLRRPKQDPEKLRAIRNLIVDMDGVLYRGRQRLRGARRFLGYLADEKVPFVLATNNSTLTPEQYVDKLAGMGMAASADQIITSALASALYLEKVAGPGTKVYAIGEDGLFSALRDKGFALTDGEPSYVVVGMDRQLTWDKLRVATLAIRGGATFIGTNPDRTLPTEEGLVPGTGANLAAVEAATSTPPLIMGKPETTLFELAMERMGVTAEGTAVVGDRLETDILGGKNAGIATVLVLSGITRREELEDSSYQPDLVFADVGAFLDSWRDQRA
jgi:4-nitrophenyl phosphatase